MSQQLSMKQRVQLRLNEIHAQMYILSEESKILNGYLNLITQGEHTEIQQDADAKFVEPSEKAI